MSAQLIARLRKLAEIEEPRLDSEVMEAWHLLTESADALERAEGCLRNCRDNLHHPDMPNLIDALEREIDEITGSAVKNP